MKHEQLSFIDLPTALSPKPATVKLEVPVEHQDRVRAYLKSLTTPPLGLVVFSPTFVTVSKGNDTKRYLINPDPVTQEESDLVDIQIERLLKDLKNIKMRREDALFYAIAAISERVGEEVAA